MSDKPSEWPNNAKEARDRAAEYAVDIIKALEPMVCSERPLTVTDRLRREARALSAAQMIARLLEGVGAPTRA